MAEQPLPSVATGRPEQEALLSGEPRVVRIGSGEVVVDTGGYLGVPAVFIEPAPAPGPLGEPANPPLPINAIQPGSVVLQIVGDVSVLINAINAVADRRTGLFSTMQTPDAVPGTPNNPSTQTKGGE